MAEKDFGPKLALVLRALTISNGRLAADLGVDKSAVGRWIAGTMAPSAHNLTRLTTHLARRLPGLTLLDWQRPLENLRGIIDNRAANPTVDPLPAAVAKWLAIPQLNDAMRATGSPGDRGGDGLTGIWRSTRASFDMPGRFVQDYHMMRANDGGPLSLHQRIFGMKLTGWAVARDNQVFWCASFDLNGRLTFAVLNRAPGARAMVLDGVVLGCPFDSGGIPMAMACLFERVGDVTGDIDADLARLDEFGATNPLAAEDAVSEPVRRHLLRDSGPAAVAAGGDMFLGVRWQMSLARNEDLESAASASSRTLRIVSG
jgi:hypothetical protein